jgi:hypothetical protein
MVNFFTNAVICFDDHISYFFFVTLARALPFFT